MSTGRTTLAGRRRPRAPQRRWGGRDGAARRALVTGITGQDGSFLAELLLERGYEVIGMVRGSPADSLGPSEHLRERVRIVHGDLLDADSLRATVAEARADEL